MLAPRGQVGRGIYRPPAVAAPNSSGQYASGSTAQASGGRPVAPPTAADSPVVPRVGKKKGGGKGDKGGGKDKGPPGIDEYLKTDEQYLQDRASLLQNFRNLRAANVANRENVNIDRNTAIDRSWEDQREQAKAMRDDFAARGLYGGGEYITKKADFRNNFLEQRGDINTSANRNITQLIQDLVNAKSLRKQNVQQARLEAIRRRAAEYGIQG